jgi:hypothetical protein
MLSGSLKSPFPGRPTLFLWLEQYVCHVSKLSSFNTTATSTCCTVHVCHGSPLDPGSSGAMRCRLLTSGVIFMRFLFPLSSLTTTSVIPVRQQTSPSPCGAILMPSTVVVGVGDLRLKPRSLASLTRVALPLAWGLNFSRPGDQRISHQTDVSS